MARTSELEALIRAADLAGILQWLRVAEDVDLDAARTWYVKGRQATQRLYSWKNEHIRQLPTEARDDVEWIRALLAVGLAGPASAAC